MSALLYFATALAAGWAIVRSGAASPRAAAVLLLLPLCLTGRALFTGGVYGPVDLAYVSEPLASLADAAGIESVANPAISDVTAQFMPWARALRQAVARHRWPLWNPYELCGTPLAGAVQSAPYYPVTILGLLAPLPDAVTFAAAMLFFTAAAGMFLLMRAHAGELPALIAAAAWMMSTHLLTFAGTAHATSVALAPFVLFAGGAIVRRPDRRATALLTVALTLLLLAGHPESALHIVALAVAYVLFEMAVRRPLPLRAVVASGLAAGAGTLLLCAIFLLPMFEAIAQTSEYLHRQAVAPARSARPAEMLHRLKANAFPWLEGAAGVEEANDASHADGWLATMYVGSVVIGPALFALVRGRARQRWFFAGALVFGLLAGIRAPGVTELLAHLPGFSLAINERMISFAALGLCALGALGVETWLREPHPLLGWSCIGYCGVIGLATATAAVALAPDYVRVGATRAIVPPLLAGLAFLVMRSPRAAVVALALVLIQRTAQTGGMQPVAPRRAFFPPFRGLEVMRGDAPFRIVGVGNLLVPEIATHYGLEDVRGFQAMTFFRFRATYPMWCVPQPVWSNRVDTLGAPFLSLLNVRFALVPAGFGVPPQWVERLATANYAVLENLAVLPRVFVPRTVHTGRDLSRTLFEMELCRDFAEDAWIDGQGPPADIANAFGSVSFHADGNGGLRIHTRLTAPAWIVVTNSAWKGWRALEGGRELPLHYADAAFLAFRAGSGEHDIRLLYRPCSFVLGAWISAVTAVVLALAYGAMPSSAITFFMSLQTSFFAAGLRRR